MNKRYAPSFVLLGLMAMFALGRGRLRAAGHASGGEGEGCTWEPPVEASSRSSVSAPEQAASASEKAQASLALHGGRKAVARMPQALRVPASLAVSELLAQGLDAEQLQFTPQTSLRRTQRLGVRQQV